jgi:chemotaxis protein MotB
MLDSARQSMKVLVDIVRANVQGAEIMVAGHTDDSPIKTLVYPSNWELSAARAATVVKEFEASHYPSHLLVAMGYGESRPAYVNRNSEGEPIAKNQEKNRRVVIKVVSPGVTKQPSPIMKTSSQKSPEGVKSPPAGPSIKAPGK